MAFIDFNDVKQRVSLTQAAQMLGLQLTKSGNQQRGPCPKCLEGGNRALVITEGKGFYCFAGKIGGDQIALAAHIGGITAKDAAQFLAGDNSRETIPQSDGGKETQKLQPLSYLEAEHDAVTAVGFDPEFCKAHGIGYAGKGMMRGYVAVPFRDERGVLLGYIGVQECKLPADFTPNVVSLEKRRA